jgi:hypothetical protein
MPVNRFNRFIRVTAMIAVCLAVGGCDDVRVYGSVGYSSYSGYGGGYGTRIAVGGRIY